MVENEFDAHVASCLGGFGGGSDIPFGAVIALHIDLVGAEGHHQGGFAFACMVEGVLLQDLTRETIQDRYPDIPPLSPEDAAAHLFGIARTCDFTLFEFFQTDVAGHSSDYPRACSVLRLYDRFLASLVRFTEAAGITLVITSDHGNIEAMNERGHTRSPVPFIVFGPREAELRENVKSLEDVTPAILKFIQ